VQDYRDCQPQLNGRRIAKVGVQRSWGKDLVVNQIVGELVKSPVCVDMTKDLAAIPRTTVREVNV
jgi:hypothetical protein